MNFDVLIVGQGLAGSLVASAMEDRGYTFLVYDEIRPYSASQYAAGLINPITGRRFVKSWQYDLLEPVFKSTYAALGTKFNTTFIRDQTIRLYLSSVKEENDLLSQAVRYGYDHLIQRCDRPDVVTKKNFVQYDLKAYQVDIIHLISLLRTHWLTGNQLIESAFNYNELAAYHDAWMYQGNVFRAIIFCEGAAVKDNPFYPDLPILPNKGQMLWVEINLPEPIALKHEVMLISHNQIGWVGATYEWDFDSPMPTPKGLEELKSKLDRFINVPYRVISHHAGIRPTTQDRRPIMVKHPGLSNMWVINGLGTKGTSVGPYLINQLMGQLKF